MLALYIIGQFVEYGNSFTHLEIYASSLDYCHQTVLTDQKGVYCDAFPYTTEFFTLCCLPPYLLRTAIVPLPSVRAYIFSGQVKCYVVESKANETFSLLYINRVGIDNTVVYRNQNWNLYWV